MVLTAVTAKVAKKVCAGATTLETPEVLMAKARGAATVTQEMPMFSLAFVELAGMFAMTVQPAVLMQPTASMASVAAPQREE